MPSTRDPDIPSVFSLGLSLFFMWLVLFFALVRVDAGLAVPAGSVLIVIYGCRLWSRFSLSRLRVELEADRDRLFPDETFRLTAVITNRKLLPIRILLELHASRELLPDDEALRGETGMYSYERTTKVWNLSVGGRGVFRAGPARILAGDLLGLHLRSRTFPFSREIVVFPRLTPLRAVDIPFQEYFGIHASKGAVEDPAWYAGTRDYTGNRPARNIHWKASARLGTLQEKLYEPTSHRKVLFVLDIEGFPGTEAVAPPADDTAPSRADMERIIEITASMARDLMETGASFGFVTNARLAGSRPPLLPMGRGPEHFGVLLEMLARVEPRTDEELVPLIREAAVGGMGYVYCGASPGGNIPRLLDSAAARRLKIFFVFARRLGEEFGTDGGEPGLMTDEALRDRTEGAAAPAALWMGCPAYTAEELLDANPI